MRQEEKIIVYVGRPERYKGFDTVLHLAAALKRNLLNFRILLPVAFNTIRPRYKELISRTAPMLILPGFLPKDELYKWYVSADVGLLCSYAEQCSYAALEMMELTKTIVASKGFGLADMFEHDKDAFCVDTAPVNDDTMYVQRLKEQIIEACTAPMELLETMANYRAKKLSEKFSPDQMRQSYENMIVTL